MQFLSNFILRRAGWVALIGTLLSIVGGHYSVLLYKNLRTNFEELLPTDARSVLDMKEVQARMPALDNLSIIVLSNETQGSKRFVTDLAKRLDATLPKELASSVEYQIKKEVQFFRDRQALYMDVEDLAKIRDYISDRIDYEKELYNPLNIFAGMEIPEPKMDFNALKSKYLSRGGAYEKFPDGYYATPDETKRVVVVYSPSGAASIDNAIKLKARVEKTIADLGPKKYAQEMEIRYAGGLQDAIEEHESLIEDLELSTIVVIAICGIALLFFYRSFRATWALLASLFVGTLWTFGASYFTVGYLNANSAFLGSIVIGNGINFGIILLARFMEERRNGLCGEEAMRDAMRFTATSTWTAALAAGLSYGSLMLTGFRGFNQFGVIGLIGMVLCWISAFTVLPAYIVLLDRWKPMVKPGSKAPEPYLAGAVASFVNRVPGLIWASSLIVTIVAIGALTRFSSSILETDLSQLRNIDSVRHGSAFNARYVDEIFQRYLSPMAALPHSREEARKVAAALKEKMLREGKDSKIKGVSTLDDYVPTRQAEKIRILEEIRYLIPPKLVQRLSPEDQKLISQFLTPAVSKPIKETDLPPLLLGKFTEKDGSIGKMVIVDPPMGKDVNDGNTLIQFVDDVRSTVDGVAKGVPIAGTLTISSDMVKAISSDGPKATLFAFLAVILLVVILFRNFVTVGLVLFALIVGMLWLGGLIFGFTFKINFLNFIALPITFGIGVDYGVNIFQRYRQEGSANILTVIRSTGGAVGLCSFTTIVGYGSLLIARNQGFVSFGTLAVAGEITCLVAAIISLPAFLLWLSRRRTVPAKVEAPMNLGT